MFVNIKDHFAGQLLQANKAAIRLTAFQVTPLDISKDAWKHFQSFQREVEPSLFVIVSIKTGILRLEYRTFTNK